MTILGVQVIIVKNNKILLEKREDFEVWSIPGGGVEDDESLEMAAIREVKEEVGIDIEIKYLLGIYSRINWLGGKLHDNFTFIAKVVDENQRLIIDKSEVVEAQYFDLKKLPDEIVPWIADRIDDFLRNEKGIIKTIDAKWPFDKKMTRQDIYKMRDKSGLSRYEFYKKYF